MKKTIFSASTLLIVLTLLCALPFPPNIYAQSAAAETDQILTAAESTFKAMKEKRYTDIWLSITRKTQADIVDRVIKASSKSGQELLREKTMADFSTGGPLAKAYWDAYLNTFNPDMVLQESAWKMGEIKKDEAQIIMQYKKAEKPAIMQMRKENGVWKTGLEETFGILRWIIK